MSTIEVTIDMMRREMWPLLETAMEGLLARACSVLEEVEQERARGLLQMAEQRAKELAEVPEERAKGFAEVDARRAELHREISVMKMHKASHEGRVELNIGGYRYETSVQTLRRLPHTFWTPTSMVGTRRMCVLMAASL
jgi:hypothetical protein